MGESKFDFSNQWLFDNASKIALFLDSNLNSARLKSNQNMVAAANGKFNSARRGKGADFWQFREHLENDESKSIAWRKSAKSDKLIVKEYEDQRPLKIQFWCDNREAMNYQSEMNLPSKAKFARLLAFSLIRYLQINFEKAALIGAPLIATKSKVTIPFLQELGKSAPQKFAQGSALLFTDGFDDIENYAQIIAQGQKANCKIIFIAIIDPKERDFNYQGRALFTLGANDKSPILINDCGEIKDKFQANYAGHFMSLRKLFEEKSVQYLEINIGSEPKVAAMEICALLMQNQIASANL